VSEPIADLLQRVTDDPWRAENPFSEDITNVHERMWVEGPDSEIAAALGTWLAANQPCLFGRIAARLGQIHYCILTASDLAQPDSFILNKIQDARSQWTLNAYRGAASAFIIAAVARSLAYARPDHVILEIAKRLTSMYLLRDVATDEIYTDCIFLEKPGRGRTTWVWDVGANYFSSHGDGRWWHDHRIPGGLALSMNSVGHLAKSGALAKALRELDSVMGGPEEAVKSSSIDSLLKALGLAMKTIDGAARTPWGPATQLLPMPGDASHLPRCPVDLQPSLQGKNYCEYQGYYHTDQTLPSAYFDARPDRPDGQPTYSLDFTYLFYDDPSNYAFATMGKGRRVRAAPPKEPQSALELSGEKRAKADARSVRVSSTRLRDLL